MEDYLVEENELSPEMIGLKSNTLDPQKKKLIIIGAGITLFLLLLIIIILSITSSRENKGNGGEGDKEKEHDPSEVLAEINCIYDVQSKTKETIIISNDYDKKFDFDIYIEDKKINYAKEYKFPSTGNHKVKFLVYQNIKMEKMFKDIPNILSVEMISKKWCKIITIESAFENCQQLSEFSIEGFDTSKLTSIKGLFYNTDITNVNLIGLNTENVVDMSYLFAFSKLSKIDLFLLDTTNVQNISYIFYNCNNLIN